MFYAKGEFSLSTYVNTPSERIRPFFLFFSAPPGLPSPQHLKKLVLMNELFKMKRTYGA